MKTFTVSLTKRFSLLALGLLVSGGLLVVAQASSRPVAAQAIDSIYLAPASGSYAVGSSFTIAVRENSGSAVNAAEANLSYPVSALEYQSIDGSGSAFGIDANSTGGNGSVNIARGTTSPVTGDQLIAKVTFKVLAITTATIQMQSSSVVLSSSTNINVVNARNGGTYTLTAPIGSTPPPAPSLSPNPSTPTPAPKANPTPSPSKPVTRGASTSAVTIASQGNSQLSALPGDSVVELSTPATVETTPTSTKPVAKVEYLVNGKLVATIKAPPYSYSVDTTKYRNGSYTLTTKTFYRDGSTDSSKASLVVKNPYGLSQVLLQLRHYLWMMVVIILLVTGSIWFIKRKNTQGPKLDAYGNDTSLNYGPALNTTINPPQTTPFISPGSSSPTETIQPSPAPAPGQVSVPEVGLTTVMPPATAVVPTYPTSSTEQK